GFGMVDVAGDDGAAAGDFVADELGGDEFGDGGAEVFTVAGCSQRLLTPEIFADCDVFHLGRDDAAAGIVHLRNIAAGPGAEHALADVGEGLDAAAAIGAELAIVLGPHVALGDFLDVAAAADPAATKLGQTGHDVDALRGVGVGAAGVVEHDRRLAG